MDRFSGSIKMAFIFGTSFITCSIQDPAPLGAGFSS
jgi:hypothetical protein